MTRRRNVNPLWSARWRKLRRAVLLVEPLCRPCFARGHVTAATEVDHVKPRAKGGEMFDRANLQPICDDCHDAKTAAENRTASTRGGACVHGTPRGMDCADCGRTE